jgi:hypothetical protein
VQAAEKLYSIIWGWTNHMLEIRDLMAGEFLKVVVKKPLTWINGLGTV